MEYDNKQTFILFAESDKKTEKSPDWTGTYTDENGKEWRAAAWQRVGKSGKTFLSGKISEQQQRETPTWEQTRERYSKTINAPTVDVPLEDISDEPISLESIPF